MSWRSSLYETEDKITSEFIVSTILLNLVKASLKLNLSSVILISALVVKPVANCTVDLNFSGSFPVK
jgi:hypothetical protein